MNNPVPLKIVSGGQTGVDRGALDAAIETQIRHGGCCPKGRKAEDGPIDAHYHLQETESESYPVRTEKNVVDSDGTLILYRRQLQGGTLLTAQLAERHKRPLLVIDLESEHACITVGISQLQQWLRDNGIERLNVAGPRESHCPGINAQAKRWLIDAIKHLEEPGV